MWKSILAFVGCVFTIVVLIAGNLGAATYLTEDFSTDFGVLIDTGGSGMSVVEDGVAKIGSASNDGRDWYGTADTDYNTITFTAQVDVVVEAGSNHASSLFFGLGMGLDADNGGLAPGFDEPSVGPAVYVAVRDNPFGSHILGDFAADSDGNVIGVNTDGPAGPGTHTLRLSHDHVGSTVDFFISLNQTGIFSLLSTVDISDNGFDATNTRVFFGAAEGRIFDNFQVGIPDLPLLPCDVNGNYVCNSSDFVAIRDSLFMQGERSDGDLTGDGYIDFADFRQFKDDPTRVTGFDSLAAVKLIPEPSTKLLTLVGVVLLVRIYSPYSS